MTSEVNTSEEPGNTNTGSFPTLRARAFQFTIHQLDTAPQIITHFKNLKTCDYGLAGLEICPETKKEHIHLYVHLKDMYKIPKKIFNYHQHIELCKGSPKQNIEYIRKPDTKIFEEWGEEPKQGTHTVKDLKAINNPDDLNWIQYNTWLKLHSNDEIDVEDLHKDVEVYYIQGPSGSGKTEKAKQIIRENKDKYGTKLSNAKFDGQFWANVGSNRKILLYDDFRDSHMKASEFIHLIDYNVHTLNIKGGNVNNDYKLIIITSIQNINDIYHNLTGEPREQWMRRIKVIDLGQTDEIDIDDF